MNLVNISKAITGISGMDNGLFTGGVICIVAIVMVFLVLLLIIVLTDIASKVIDAAAKKEEVAAPAAKTAAPAPATVSSAAAPLSRLDINDEDATVAALVASIDYREETGKNIRVVSVKKVG